MTGNTISKSNHQQLNKSSNVGRKSIAIESKKLKQFCYLWSIDTPREDICNELKIKQAQYYNYIDAAEEIVDDFLLGMVDHGIILQFKDSLKSVQERRVQLDKITNRMVKKFEIIDPDADQSIVLNRMVSLANQTDKLYTEMLDDIKIVNQTMKVLNKVIAKSKSNNQ